MSNGQVESASRRANRLTWALLVYAIALAVCLLVPPYLTIAVGPPTAFTLQEVADLLTPLIVIPLAWLVYDLAGGSGRARLLAFLVIAAVWIEGQGIHLAANAIGDAFSHDAAKTFYTTVPGDLDLWLDETLSHWMWHAAWVALSFLILAAASRIPAAPSGRPVVPAAAGVVHGLTFFLVTVEGVTTLLGIPASILLLVWTALTARQGLAGRPVVAFFLVASVVTLLGYLGWGALHGWTLPEFSKVGLF